MFEFLFNAQRRIHAILSSDISAFAQTGDWAALLAVLPFGIAFGVAHALTPGHSKSVLASYVLGSGLAPARAMLTSFVPAATHVSSAVLLAVVTNTLVTRTLVGAGRAPEAGLAFALAMLIGVGAVLSAVALATACARDALGHIVSRHGQSIQTFSRMIEGLAGVVLVLIAIGELAR